MTSTPSPGGGQTYTLSIQTLLFLTALTFLPAALLMMTAFTRIVIVLSLLRQALGTMQSPTNQVIVGMSLFLTFFVMAPVFEKIYNEAYQPYVEKKIDLTAALEKGAEPLKTFMLRQTRHEDLALFVKLSNSQPLAGPEAVPLRILVPAYVTSELKTAFQIGFLIFIPFPHHRYGRCERADVDGYDDAVARHDFPAFQADAVRAGGWLGSPHGFIGAELLHMTPETVMTVGRHALEVTMLLAAPILLAALVTGLLVSIFQAATQINEMTLSFIPKLLVMFLVMFIAGPSMITLMVDYMRQLFSGIPGMIG